MTAQDRPPPGRYRLTISDYMRLAGAGAFVGVRTELIDGEVQVMPPQHRPHAVLKMELFLLLHKALGELNSPLRAIVEVSLALDDHSMPAPDLVLTSEPRGEGPVPLASAALAIEVADTSLADNLGPKAALYARTGVPEYWVADVRGRAIHQMWRPADGGYRERRVVPFGAPLAAATIPGLVGTGDL